MSQINPFTGSILQATAAQAQQSVERDRATAKVTQLRRNIAYGTDTYEHSVESAEELAPLHDEQGSRDDQRQKKKRKPTNPAQPDDPPTLDVKA